MKHIININAILEDYTTDGLTSLLGLEEVFNYLNNHSRARYKYEMTDWPNGEGGVCSIALIDNIYNIELINIEYSR